MEPNTPPETFDEFIIDTDILTLLSKLFSVEDADPEDRELKNEGCFICTNLAMANEDKTILLVEQKLGLMEYVSNILQTTDATQIHIENALWVLYNLFSDYQCLVKLIEEHSILDHLITFLSREGASTLTQKHSDLLGDLVSNILK